MIYCVVTVTGVLIGPETYLTEVQGIGNSPSLHLHGAVATKGNQESDIGKNKTVNIYAFIYST